MNSIIKYLGKAAVGITKSIITTEVRGKVKSFLAEKRAKTPAQIEEEMQKSIGYVTGHYSLNKNSDIIYKPSIIFMHEWLTNSPLVSEKINRDEESGHVYINEELIRSSQKIELVNKFIKSTGVKVPSLSSQLEGALKLIEVSDFNAVKFKNYFSGWDPESPSIIDEFFIKSFKSNLDLSKVNEDYVKLLFRKWVIGTAKRAINPGQNFDGCLTLQGPSGTGKTSFFRNLLPEPFDKRTGEILCNIRQPTKFVESIKGKTIACFDELSVLDYQKSEEVFKQLLSSQHIDVRLAWAREPRRYALRQGFCATSNKSNFIPDKFFSRRLWTIPLNDNGRVDFDYLFENRELLWKEAIYCALNNESSNLSFEEQKMVEENNKQFLKK